MAAATAMVVAARSPIRLVPRHGTRRLDEDLDSNHDECVTKRLRREDPSAAAQAYLRSSASSPGSGRWDRHVVIVTP